MGVKWKINDVFGGVKGMAQNYIEENKKKDELALSTMMGQGMDIDPELAKKVFGGKYGKQIADNFKYLPPDAFQAMMYGASKKPDFDPEQVALDYINAKQKKTPTKPQTVSRFGQNPDKSWYEYDVPIIGVDEYGMPVTGPEIPGSRRPYKYDPQSIINFLGPKVEEETRRREQTAKAIKDPDKWRSEAEVSYNKNIAGKLKAKKNVTLADFLSFNETFAPKGWVAVPVFKEPGYFNERPDGSTNWVSPNIDKFTGNAKPKQTNKSILVEYRESGENEFNEVDVLNTMYRDPAAKGLSFWEVVKMAQDNGMTYVPLAQVRK